VVQEFVNACRKYDMKVGLYYSPAQFGLDTVQAKAYDDYFISQVSELLTNYGKIDYIWFDGCGSENHEYDKDRIVREIRRLQPGILIFTMWDPDTRWIGNESGIAPLYNRLTVSSMDFSIKQAVPDLLDEPQFLPAECDARMRLENWFYSDSDTDTVKSLDELMGMYYYSVGRGANLLLNIGPDRRGKLPEPDKKALLAFGKKVKEVLGSEIACKVTQAENKVTVDTPLQLVNHVILSEEIDPDCEIEEFEIKVYPFPYGIPITVYKGATVGHKAICSFPTIRTNKIEITFDKPKRVNAKILYIPKY